MKVEDKIKKCDVISNFTLITVGVLRKQIIALIEIHKKLGIKLPCREASEWRTLLNACNILTNRVMFAEIADVCYYNECVNIMDFILRELDSRCDDSNTRIWQFHNLLKSYPVVNEFIAPTYDEELEAFRKLIEQGDESNERFNKL
ncbi:MAG: hypothetical protein MJ209_00265 [archaeon]|nr:hypothetical protein [archaeon]